MDVGAMTVFLHTFTEREKIYNLCESLTGARFTTTYTRIGGRFARLAARLGRAMPQVSATKSSSTSPRSETLLTRNRIFVDRTRDVGVISKEDAIDYGLTGPNLRGSGVDYDLRKAHPYLCYDHLQFDVPVGSVGDCYDRYLVRMEEMRQSVRIVHQCLDKLPGGDMSRSTCPTARSSCRRRTSVLTSMEELIHQFILVTQGVNAPPGEIYFGARKIRRANWAFTSTAKAAARRIG